MASLSRGYARSYHRRRFGPRAAARPPAPPSPERYAAEPQRGSFMPLDTGIHWEWSNPLNSIPAVLLLLTLVAIVGMLI